MITYLLLLLAVALATAGQVFQKLAVDRAGEGDWTRGHYLHVARRPELYLALFCIGAGSIVWLFVLYEFDVSRVYPFVSLGQVAVVLSARIFFGEKVSLTRWIGVILIARDLNRVLRHIPSGRLWPWNLARLLLQVKRVRRGRLVLLGLKPEHRAVLLLRVDEGMRYDEIAEALSISRGTVMSRLHRARARMKKLLEDYR